MRFFQGFVLGSNHISLRDLTLLLTILVFSCLERVGE
jgi:hypothetical protein